MSSFDYTDNFSGFNDLINRADFLTEMADTAKKAIAQLAKTKDGKVGLNDLIKMYQHKTKGTSPAASYAKNMLWLVAMAEQGFITDEQKEFIKNKTNMGSSTAFAKAVQHVAPVANAALYGKEQKSEDLIKFVGDNSIVLLRRAIMNMPGDNYIYIGPDVEDKELDAAVSSQKVEDDIEDVADDMESRFEKGVLGGIRGGVDYEKEIQDLPFDDVDVSLEELENKDEIAAKIVELINTTGNLTAEVTPIGFNIEGPVGVFVDSDTITDQMNRLITKYFPNVGGRDIPVRLNTSVGEEDYEQIDDEEYEGPSMANNPGGAPSSYAQGEEGGGLTTPEDAEDELDHFLTKEQPEDKIPADYEDVLAALVDDDKKKHAIKRLYGDDDDPGHIDDMRAEYPPDPFGGGYEDEEGDAEKQDLIKMANDILGNLEDRGYRELAARGISGVDDDYDDDAIDMLYNLIDQGWTRGSEAFRLARRIVDFGRRGLKEGEERPFETGFENEEEFSYSPMLDSYKTSTADYLTEQAASDKRNKKTEVKKETFKEKYKPKTHWQLEELRRYGL